MSKQRVHEFAKANGMDSKEVIKKLDAIGIKEKKAVSSLTAEEAEKLKKFMNQKNTKPNNLNANNAKQNNTKQNNAKPNNTATVSTTEDDKPKPKIVTPQMIRERQAAKNQRPHNRDNNGQNRSNNGGQGRSYNNDRNNGGQGRSYNNDRNNGGQGRSYNNDRNNGGQGRTYNNDRNNGGQGRTFNNDRNNGGQGRTFNNDRNNGGQGRSYNNDRNNGGQGRTFNNDRNNGGTRGAFGRNGNDRDKDKDTVEKVEKSKSADKVNRKMESRTKSKKKQEIKESKWVEETTILEELKNKKNKKNEIAQEEILLIEVPENITIKDLAEKLKVAPKDIITKLFKKGVMATINQSISFEEATEIAESYDVLVEKEEFVDVLEREFGEEDENVEKATRPPVVVVMGHVDHGKTSLLDAIKKTNVTEKESGGITQHIGAYTVTLNNKIITFLDTPGHEAFTAMRMRGAQVTDIAILVVAADDGVMPQTIEAISHAKAAGVEIIVAINKIDKPGANPDRVKQELTEHGIIVEEWGGDVISVPVSAKEGTGIDDLLEMINLSADTKELKAAYNTPARGTIIESSLDKGRGVLATVLVQSGTLKVSDPVVVGDSYGRVRAMIDDKGKRVDKAEPSIPVEILGLSTVPKAGDLFYVAKNERQARQLSESVDAQNRMDMIKSTPQKVTLDDLYSQMQSGTTKQLNIIIKADVQGSVEAVKTSLEKLSNDEIAVKIIHGGVGAITESDVTLASASNALIIGFNVREDVNAKVLADNEKVEVKTYTIIYNAIEDVTTAMNGMYDPIFEEQIIGSVEVRAIFKSTATGTIAGSYVTDGKVTRKSSVRLKRGKDVIYDGPIDSLKRFKDEVKEVSKGYECGIVLPKFNDIKEEDIFEVYEMVQVPRK